MRKYFVALLLAYSAFLCAREDPPPLLSLGAGDFAPGHHHETYLVQAEYLWDRYLFWCVRPRLGVMTPGFSSLFLYGGIGLDLYVTDHLMFTPNFAPGLYFKGSGKDLGCLLEFRSTLELSYEFDCKVRLGGQFFHISNASLGSCNPGANSWVLFLAFPLICPNPD